MNGPEWSGRDPELTVSRQKRKGARWHWTLSWPGGSHNGGWFTSAVAAWHAGEREIRVRAAIIEAQSKERDELLNDPDLADRLMRGEG